jgi:GNAT superfamily N-acetyltransferase
MPAADAPAPPWSIRVATPDDADAIALHRFDERPAPPDAVAHYAAWLRPRIAGGQYLGRLAMVDDQVIGGAGAVLLDWGPRKDTGAACLLARINNVFTEPDWRRRGVARALLHAVLAGCRDRDIVYATLSATADGAALYRRLGFAAKPDEMTLRLVAAPAGLSS